MVFVMVLLKVLGKKCQPRWTKESPLHVAKMFRDGTRGMHSICLFLDLMASYYLLSALLVFIEEKDQNSFRLCSSTYWRNSP